MKKFLAIACTLIMILTITGCDDNKSSDVILKNNAYSYESTGTQSNASYAFYDKEYLTKLNESYELDKLVKDCKSDLEKVQVITKWVTNLWKHDGTNQPEQNDVLFILDEVTKNNKQFRCVEYGAVIAGCLLALDIPARTIGLKMMDVETIASGAGHVATEAYIKDLNKWIFIDGQFGTIPMLDDVPLNAVEFAQALTKLTNGEKLDLIILPKDDSEVDLLDYKLQYYSWVKPYLYYFDVDYLMDGKNVSTMLTPIGAKNPTIFQIDYPLTIDIYTNSVVDFYSIPK